ncbi:lipopolysaccharide heptosyltransferase I [Chitinasiproducens palmae]|uniref:Lipopolysaccharide heptosyltransferase 1 n=1 Tax=Chitinasiproducens palmae TaxID=1770053 RepID=A0A1H2PL01_9BURK|nr:lipopolysaccharide heptosyltransferase I [Chitinasiproducens palmae]SDV46698.1 heptosyltransferase-1 [Chitinasiproducens palmae]
MKRALIVKVTSLGDVVHCQPLVADLRRAFPGIGIDWALDAAFADIPRWNPGVDRVLSAPLRRFKSARSLSDMRAIAASIGELRRVRYDAVLDVHGVYKSAIISFLARARHRYGYRARDLGERGAAFAYSRRFSRQPGHTAWQGVRETVGQALGYSVSHDADFGLVAPTEGPLPVAVAGSYAVLLHAASGDEKKWPIKHWQQVARALVLDGVTPLLPWHAPAEQRDAAAIAAAVPEAVLLPRLSVADLGRLLASATVVVGVDTGLTHLANAFGRPTVMIFVATSRELYGIDRLGSGISVGEEGTPPSVDAVREAIAAVRPAPDGQLRVPR